MEKKVVKLLAFSVKDGAYGMVEYEIPEDVLKKQAKVISKTEPDIFAVFVNNITKKSRELLGI